MDFKKSYEFLKQGKHVKRKEWGGYWKWENNTIMIHCKDGKVLDIRDTEDVDFTMSNILANDWEVVEDAKIE
ncbi:DUF2829 domain-containing protein [Clostridium cochlearium]|uniref:DUF2829 domain-containing protein n=1 Tax=Clostridium cochlearium TaxID=1494 RepID=UPI001C0F0260|nr:DUF2829 domain-containing protein [Clostridium cochlearium]MBU5268901.1 DUF2829 domain-containing protein [Clostridium cochlearium]